MVYPIETRPDETIPNCHSPSTTSRCPFRKVSSTVSWPERCRQNDHDADVDHAHETNQWFREGDGRSITDRLALVEHIGLPSKNPLFGKLSGHEQLDYIAACVIPLEPTQRAH